MDPIVGFMENFNLSDKSLDRSGMLSTDDLINVGTPDGGSCAAFMNVKIPERIYDLFITENKNKIKFIIYIH